MKRGPQGHLLTIRTSPEPFQAFIPKDLPPEPFPSIDRSLVDQLEKANRALGRLDGLATLLPDISLFLYFYVRKEAVLSSQIEGTQSSLSDLLLFESHEVPGVPLDDVQEVSNYVAALNHGLERIRRDVPLTSRLLREMHQVLLQEGRGSDKQPGEFRSSQVWIGGSRPGNATFVPPPHYEVIARMSSLDKFLHDSAARTPTLMKAAMAHVQFETIHPFLDGNGRLGRLLITLILCYENALREPLLYLSLYFKTHRSLYFELLQSVRTEGDWERWISFFLDGVQETADQAAQTAHRIIHLFDEDRRRIEQAGRAAGTMTRVHSFLQKRPLSSINSTADALELSWPATASAFGRLESMGMVRETSGRRRNKIYVYDAYLAILSEGTEPIP